MAKGLHTSNILISEFKILFPKCIFRKSEDLIIYLFPFLRFRSVNIYNLVKYKAGSQSSSVRELYPLLSYVTDNIKYEINGEKCCKTFRFVQPSLVTFTHARINSLKLGHKTQKPGHLSLNTFTKFSSRAIMGIAIISPILRLHGQFSVLGMKKM